MDYSKTPLWMQDDLVKDIPREKTGFSLETFLPRGTVKIKRNDGTSHARHA